MTMEKVTCLQEKDGIRRIVTERWELVFKPLEDLAEYSKEAPIFKISYLKDGVEKWLGDAKMTENSVFLIRQHPELTAEERSRVISCTDILWHMAQLEKV